MLCLLSKVGRDQLNSGSRVQNVEGDWPPPVSLVVAPMHASYDRNLASWPQA